MIRLRSDAGQSLVIVLITVSAIAVMATGLMGLASTTAKANQGTTLIVRDRESGDAAAEYGLQKVIAGAASTYVASPGAVTMTGPTVNGNGSSVSITQRNLASITVTGPVTLAVNAAATYQAQFTEGASTFTFPSGVVWSVSPTSGTTLTQDGTFSSGVPGAYTIKATVNNVSATRAVTVS